MNGGSSPGIVTLCVMALGVIVFAAALVRALGRDQDLVSPSGYRDGRIQARPPRPGEPGPDLAWPLYPYRQSYADLARVRASLVRMNGILWRPGRWFFGRGAGWWFLFLLPALVIFLLIEISLVSWVCFAVYALVHTAITGTSLLFLVPASAVLRAAERARRTRKLTQASCARCFHVTSWPAFECRSCGFWHHDVRPGRLGLLVRRCGCGAYLPTMASRAAWAVTSRCKRCGVSLPEGSGAVRDVRVPVFGDVSAGKTRFVYASLGSVMATVPEVTFPDGGSRSLAESGLDVIRYGRDTAKTPTGSPVTLTFRLGQGRRSELVHLSDAAGEDFRTVRDPGALRFIDEGHGLVYVLDPFSVERIRDQAADQNAEALAHSREAGDPRLTYDNVVSRLRDSVVSPASQALAVVIPKADLLRSAGLAVPHDSEPIAQWLRDAGAHNLVQSAFHDFGTVRFFTVESRDIPPGAPGDPGAPIRWILASHGARVPEKVQP